LLFILTDTGKGSKMPASERKRSNLRQTKPF